MEASKFGDYEEHFKPDKVPPEIVKLLKFDEPRPGLYSFGFQMDCSDVDHVGLKTYSEDPEFLRCFREFAAADCTGSTYAIWRQHDKVSWSDSPIVAFGSEGGVHVVARNLVELFRILTLDTEPMIGWDGVTYYKDEDAEQASEGAADFAKWLEKTFNVKPVKGNAEAEKIVAGAQKPHQKAFQEWMKQYYSA
jgi:hypothetical protein